MRLKAFLCAVAVISSNVHAQTDHEPEFFGVYALTSANELIEIPPVKVYSYKSFERRSAGDSGSIFADNDISRALSAERRYYINGRPRVSLRLGEVKGFYVFGNYDVESFFITSFEKPPLTQNTILVEPDTGPGIRGEGNYVDSRFGFELMPNFRYVENKPKLYWIVPKSELSLLDKEFAAVVLRDSDGASVNYFPFMLKKEEFAELGEEAWNAFEDKDFDRALELAQHSRQIKPTPGADWIIVVALGALGRHDEALAAAVSAAKSWADMPQIRILEADAHLRANDLATAERLYRHLMSEDLPLPDASYGLALTLYIQGKSDEATEYLQQSMNATRGQHRTSVMLAKLHGLGAIIHADLSDYKKCKGEAEKALGYDSESRSAKLAFAQAEFELERDKNAKRVRRNQEDFLSETELLTRLAGIWEGELRLQEGEWDVRLVIDDQTRRGHYEWRSQELQNEEWSSVDVNFALDPARSVVRLFAPKRMAFVDNKLSLFEDFYASINSSTDSIEWSSPGGEVVFFRVNEPSGE